MSCNHLTIRSQNHDVIDSGHQVYAEKCRMSNCFNWDRCRDSSKPIRIHIYPEASAIVNDVVSPTYQKILNTIESSLHFEPNASLACLFIPRFDTLTRDSLSPDFSQTLASFELMNEGRNHLIFNLYSGTWPDYHELDFDGFDPGYAILAKASSSSGIYRRGFDISLPLFSTTHPESVDSQKIESVAKKSINCDTRLSAQQKLILDRKTPNLVVFKGKRYITGIGGETRNFLHHIHNDDDILIYTTCKHGKKWKEAHDERCEQDNSKYDLVDYMSLMGNSTFCLTPRGRRLGSFRFLEALSIGCIPVVLSNDWIKPFSEIIDWSSTIVNADERSVLQIPETLRSFTPHQISRMKSKCLKVYNQYFSSIKRIVLTTISILEERIHGKESGKYQRST